MLLGLHYKSGLANMVTGNVGLRSLSLVRNTSSKLARAKEASNTDMIVIMGWVIENVPSHSCFPTIGTRSFRNFRLALRIQTKSRNSSVRHCSYEYPYPAQVYGIFALHTWWDESDTADEVSNNRARAPRSGGNVACFKCTEVSWTSPVTRSYVCLSASPRIRHHSIDPHFTGNQGTMQDPSALHFQTAPGSRPSGKEPPDPRGWQNRECMLQTQDRGNC